MEYAKRYKFLRRRVVEEIEQVESGYRWRVAAHDDNAGRGLRRKSPGGDRFLMERKRFLMEGTAATLEAAQAMVDVAVLLMRQNAADAMR
jgi:hypothetical protein